MDAVGAQADDRERRRVDMGIEAGVGAWDPNEEGGKAASWAPPWVLLPGPPPALPRLPALLALPALLVESVREQERVGGGFKLMFWLGLRLGLGVTLALESIGGSRRPLSLEREDALALPVPVPVPVPVPERRVDAEVLRERARRNLVTACTTVNTPVIETMEF